ncbi:hypothetical protein L1887_55200 [Cichorium endivia]|nr:hypothetical protein L1887_55200 [Cichorium endivia]
MCKCRSHGTFPLFGLQSSHLNICYYHQDPHRRPLRPGSRPRFCSDRRALLLIGAWHLPRRPGVGQRALKRHPFSGLVDSADERFARQYRCGPPPEFPLASPRSGIVHHLSGPDRHAHTRTLLRRSRSVGRRCTPLGGSRQSASLRLAGRCRVARRYIAETARACQPRSTRRHLHEPIDSSGFGRRTNPHRSTPRVDRRTGYRRSTSDRDASPAPIRFPPDNFKHSLTLFSKSFSSFPSAVLVCYRSHAGYLALDGIYRPIGAAFPNNPTRRQRLVVRQGSGHDGALTLSGAPFQGTWARSAAEDASPDYNSDSEAVRFSSWADPGSLAVTKGILLTDTRHNTRVFSTTTSRASTEGDSSLGQPHHKHGRPISAPMPCVTDKGCMVGATRCVTPRAGVPSAGWLWAQLAFKNSMVHGILQFTPSIAFCYVLHRCVSRDIRCAESRL